MHFLAGRAGGYKAPPSPKTPSPRDTRAVSTGRPKPANRHVHLQCQPHTIYPPQKGQYITKMYSPAHDKTVRPATAKAGESILQRAMERRQWEQEEKMNATRRAMELEATMARAAQPESPGPNATTTMYDPNGASTTIHANGPVPGTKTNAYWPLAPGSNLTAGDLGRSYDDLGIHSVPGSANSRLVGGRWR